MAERPRYVRLVMLYTFGAQMCICWKVHLTIISQHSLEWETVPYSMEKYNLRGQWHSTFHMFYLATRHCLQPVRARSLSHHLTSPRGYIWNKEGSSDFQKHTLIVDSGYHLNLTFHLFRLPYSFQGCRAEALTLIWEDSEEDVRRMF